MNEAPRKERETQPAEFIGKLAKLDDGDRARLKRNAGKSLAESHGVRLLFYSRVAPRGIADWQEERYFLLATLYPLDKAQRNRDRGLAAGDDEAITAPSAHSLGRSLRQLRVQDEKNADGLDRRFARLLDATIEELPFHLRQSVARLTNEGLPIDWAQLTDDILHWNHPQRYVQRQWARDYVAAEPQKQPTQTN